MSELDLNAIEQRANAATKGPWWQDGANCLPWEVSPGVFEFAGKRIRVFPTGDNENEMDCIDDAKFIANAREDIPALIKRVRELEAADNEVSRASVALAERVRELEAELPKWQRYASYLHCSAKGGIDNVDSFEEFVARNYAAKGAADAK